MKKTNAHLIKMSPVEGAIGEKVPYHNYHQHHKEHAEGFFGWFRPEFPQHSCVDDIPGNTTTRSPSLSQADNTSAMLTSSQKSSKLMNHSRDGYRNAV